MRARGGAVVVPVGAALLIAAALLFDTYNPSDPPIPARAGSRPLTGVYVLDTPDFRSRLEEEAVRWAAVQTRDRPGAERDALEREGRARARQSAEQTRVRLDLRPDGTFSLSVQNGRGTSTGHGRWTRTDAHVGLHTERVDGPRSPGPIPALHAVVEGDGLLMRPSPGIPFAHRLVRAPRAASSTSP